jgi:rod shape-determining protein MreD
MRVWTIALSFGIALGIQTTVVRYFSPFGLIPDIILLTVVALGLLKGPFAGVTLGFAGGYITDFVGGPLLGANALAKLTVGLICGLMEKTIFKDNLLVPAIAAFIATFIQDIIIFLVLFSFSSRTPFLYHLARYTIPLSIYHMLLAPAVYYGIYRLEHFFLLRRSA